MSELADIIEGKAEKFDALRETFFPPGATLEFLEFNEETDDFDPVDELENSWYFEESKRYSTSPVFESSSPVFKVSVAKQDDDAEFIETINDATHVRVRNEVYVIRPNYTRQPDGEEGCWRLFCERHLSRSQFV